MGKRELLLISGFVVIGLLVYQLTMPATADTGGGFSAWWAKVRSHVSQNWVESRRTQRKDEVKVPAGTRMCLVQAGTGASATIFLPRRRQTSRRRPPGVVDGGDEEYGEGAGEGDQTLGRDHGDGAANASSPSTC